MLEIADYDLDPDRLRAVRGPAGRTLWHFAAHQGRVEVCEWLGFPSWRCSVAGKVPAEHLAMPDSNGRRPMEKAFVHNPDYVPIMRMLILRGVTRASS